MSDKATMNELPSPPFELPTAADALADRSIMIRAAATPDARVDLLRDTLLALVRRDGRDLTARQLTTFLIVYSRDQVQSVSSLAELMNVSRPGITRVMDRLVQFDLLGREEDADDRRRVLARRTARGHAFHAEIMAMARSAAEGRVDGLPPAHFKLRGGGA